MTTPEQDAAPPATVRDSDGYLNLCRGGRASKVKVAHLVAEAFIGPRPDGSVLRHLDGNPANNTPANLRYGSQSENQYDAVGHGTHAHAAKTHCPKGHPYDGPSVPGSRQGRRCRVCRRDDMRRRYAAQRERLAS